MNGECPVRLDLQAKANEILAKLVELTTAQLEAFRSQRHDEFMRLDKELELTVGAKERVVGAVRQHAQDHGCQKW